MSDEIDFGQFIELLDKALTSKDPNIQKALKKFLFIASLASDDTPSDGPFSKMVKTMEDLQRRLALLEALQHANSNPGYFPNSQPYTAPYQSPGWGPSSPTWPWPSTSGGTPISIPTVWTNANPSWQGQATPISTTTTTVVSSSDDASANFVGGASPGASISFTNYMSNDTRNDLISRALSDMDALASVNK